MMGEKKHRVVLWDWGNLPKKMSKDSPLKINMEHNHGGLEDHFPFKMGDW